MMQVRDERVERTMEATGMDRMQAVNFERARNFVNDQLRRGGKMPSWAVKPSWAVEG